MKPLFTFIFFFVILHCSYAPPVTPDKDHEKDSDVKDDLEEYMEYHRYLKEVVQALESDPDFRERLEKADEDDVRSGKIAEQLDFVNHNIRTKLDEIKRRELERLRHLATKQFELTHNQDIPTGKGNKELSNEHLDHANPHTFEIEDLKKLIKKTTADLEAADKQRKQEFKEYEMQKEYEKHQKMEAMDEAQKKEFEAKLKAEEDAKKHHQPLHHPGSKQQLEEVWEKQDHMDQQFDPKAFFMMHDVDGNGVWDADEVKALFIKELDKIYGPGGPNKDLHERAEEMERMREHVFNTNDRNRDGLIDYHEFITETQKAEFNQDEGWKPIEQNEIYTQNEYEEFERRRLEEKRYMQQRGLIDAHGNPLPGVHPQQIHQAYREYHAYQQQHHGQAPEYHPQAPHYQGQAPQYQGQAPPQYQGQQQYYPQGQVPQGQVPQQGYQQQNKQGYQQPQNQQGYQQPTNQQNYQYQQNQAQYQQPPQGQYQAQVSQQQGQNLNQPPPVQASQGQNQPANQQQQIQTPENQGQASNQGQVPQSQGQVLQNQGQVPQNQGQVPQNQGQVPQNHGQVPQNQGQVPQTQAQLPQGQNQLPVQNSVK